MILMSFLFFFFFQAEDGIRDVAVTGVQTCALPISAQPRLATLNWLRLPSSRLGRRGRKALRPLRPWRKHSNNWRQKLARSRRRHHAKPQWKPRTTSTPLTRPRNPLSRERKKNKSPGG